MDDFDDGSGLDWTGLGNDLLGDVGTLAGSATTAGSKSIVSAITGQPLAGNTQLLMLILVALVVFVLVERK